MENDEMMNTIAIICDTISTKGVYANYGWNSEKLSELLQISDPAEINGIMLHISRLSFLKTPRSMYQWATAKYINLFGFNNSSEIEGKLDIELAWSKEVADIIQDADERVITTSSACTFECRAMLPKVGERFFKAKLYPIYSANKEIAGILGVVIEVLSSDMQSSRNEGIIEAAS